MNSQTIHSVSNLLLLSDCEFEPAFKCSVSNLLVQFGDGNKNAHVSIIDSFERFFQLVKVVDNLSDGEIIQNVVSALVAEFAANLSQTEDMEILKCRLEENIHILSSLDVLINRLASISDLNAEIISSIPKDAVSVLLIGFEYCKNSSNLTILNDQITQLFKSCYSFLRDYFIFINKLQINCQYESEFNLLTEILDKMYEIGALVISLDLKTMAELWKGYTQVLKTYSSHLRNEFDVSKIIRFLIHQISERITSLDNTSDDKLLTLTLKICVFLLKIIVKLCEYFQGSFGDCSPELFEFVLFLYKHSCFLCEFSGLDVELASKIDTYLVPGVDPLLSNLINDRQFARYYLNYSLHDKTSWDKTAALLLSSFVLRKLLMCSDEAVNFWINDTETSILRYTFKLLSDSETELYYDMKISLPCSDASLSQEVYIYDALLVSFSSLIINEVSCEKFLIVENLLMKNLLNSTPSTGLFICDLWCILARYASSDLCFEHVKYLILISNELPEGCVQVLVRSLLKRLFGFLSLNHQLQIISELPRDENFINCYSRLGNKFRGQVCQKTVADMANKYKYLQMNLKQKFDGDNYIKMVNLVNLLCTLEPAYWKDYTHSMTEFIIQTWKRFRAPAFTGLTSKEFQSLFESLPYLTRITCIFIPHLGNSQILDILRSLRFLMNSKSLRIELCCLKILQSLQNYQIDSCFDEITNHLAECFNFGLTSESPMLKQFFLDGFTRFSHVTSYETIISLTISKNKLVAEQVARYLQRNPCPMTENQTFLKFLIYLIEKPLKTKATECSNNIDKDFNDREMISAKRIKLEDDFDDKIIQAENLLVNIFDRIQHNRMNQRQKEAVIRILRSLDKWKDYV